MPRDFKKLEIWKDSHSFILYIYKITTSFPQTEQFGIVQQLRRAAVSISSNIAEGCGRNTNRDLIRFIFIAYGSLKECESLIVISYDLSYLKQKDFSSLNDKADVLGKKLYKFAEGVKKLMPVNLDQIPETRNPLPNTRDKNDL